MSKFNLKIQIEMPANNETQAAQLFKEIKQKLSCFAGLKTNPVEVDVITDAEKTTKIKDETEES